MKRWRCSRCGYMHIGNEPPQVCPVCGAPQDEFELLKQDASALGVQR